MEPKRPDKDIATAKRGAMSASPDTEGHSMVTYELGMTLERERRRQAERASRDAGWSATRSGRPSAVEGLRHAGSSSAASVREGIEAARAAIQRAAASRGQGIVVRLSPS